MLAINVYDVKPQKAKIAVYDRRMNSPRNIRKVIAANLRALMQSHVDLNTQMKIQERTNKRVSQRTVGRILEGSVSVTVDNLADLAHIFGLQPWQMLLPNLDPTNPQIVPALTPAEQKMYASIQAAVEAFQASNT